VRCLPSVLALVLLVSCGRYKEDRWPHHAARVSCKTLRRCDSANYYNHYASLDACITDSEGSAGAPVEGCTYDKKAARECVDAMKWSCTKIGERYDELVARCNAVWNCPDVQETGLGGPL
jgi:hypothetical protein